MGLNEDEVAAERVIIGLLNRVALNEAVGVLAAWGGCGEDQARTGLRERAGGTVEAEVARVAAVTDAAADGGADPDWK